MKILAEKQEATELFIEEQQEAAISEAEARLAELQERSKMLRESQGQIEAAQQLSDTELIKVCKPRHFFTLLFIWLQWDDCNITPRLFRTAR